MHPDIRSALDKWQRTTESLERTTRTFPTDALDRPSAEGDWTNRQLLVHLATGYPVRIAVLEHVVEGAPLDIDLAASDERNAMSIPQHASKSPHEIADLLLENRGRIAALVSRLEERHLDLVAPVSPNRPHETLREVLASLNDHDTAHATNLRP